jgi:hypothetical protein
MNTAYFPIFRALNLTFAKDGNQNGSFKLVDYTLKAIFYPPFNYSQGLKFKLHFLF